MKKWLLCGCTALLISGASAFGIDGISMKGDVRLRYENIDVDDGRDDRDRSRIRARLSLSGGITETVTAHLRIASGGDDPISTNQSFDDGFSTKDFGLDRAYVDWAVQNGLNVWAGKMKQPFNRTGDLTFDDDLSPEGGALRYSGSATDVTDVYANASVWVAEERSGGDDTTMLGVQAGVDSDASDTLSVGAGVSFYYWDNMQGFETLGGSAGNTVAGDGAGGTTYVNDYEVFEVSLTLAMTPAQISVPIDVYGNYIVNNGADSGGATGYLVGVQIGTAKAPKTWSFDYNYRDLEADATVGAFTDSDSFGGGTNGEGHRLEGRYAITDNIQSSLVLFLQKLDPDGADTDYTRLHADISFRF